ncbi:MAG: hypothetical protein EBV84_07985 [Betaproteobacteria bacterium]|nr:hypothetical protein [Betaproteobacteria bacterium]
MEKVIAVLIWLSLLELDMVELQQLPLEQMAQLLHLIYQTAVKAMLQCQQLEFGIQQARHCLLDLMQNLK